MAISVDRLSSLPDSVILAIISLLPFKEAVRSSVLSRSWLNFHKGTANLEFNELFFVKPDESEETREAQRMAFLNFGTLWLDNNRGHVLSRVSLRLSVPKSASDFVLRSIAFAIEHGVKELELDFTDPAWSENNVYHDDHHALFELPRHVYKHTCLESLKLYSCSFVNSEVVNFHSLKDLSLGWMEVTISALNALLTNCKAIESLSLKKCWSTDNYFSTDDSETTLKKLVVEKCRLHCEIFHVQAPNMKYFKYSGLLNYCIVQVYSNEIEEVDLDFSLEYGFEGHGPFIYSMMEDLSDARVLTLCSYFLQVIPSGDESRRMKYDLNVRHLKLRTALHENEVLGIAFMLNSCPMLESLTVELGPEKFLFGYEPPFQFNRKRFWIDEASVYECLRSSLKEVKIKGFTGVRNEVQMINYLIKHGRVLKKISIDVMKDEVAGDDGRNIREWEEMFGLISWASKDLEILIS